MSKYIFICVSDGENIAIKRSRPEAIKKAKELECDKIEIWTNSGEYIGEIFDEGFE